MKSRTKKLLLLLVGFIFYLTIGGFIFEAVEQGKNTGESRMRGIFHKMKSKQNLTREDFNAFLSDIQEIFQSTNYGSEWSFYSSMYFCGSVVTTIGYGHMTPKTEAGRIILIFYALIGIPLNLWTLKVLGDTITALLTGFISKFEKIVLRKEEEKRVKLKVVAAMATLNIAILLLGGVMYMVSEGWSYVESVYYCFIVYSTIGFGDLVPNEGHKLSSSNEIFMMFVRALNLMIGLSLLSSLLSSIIQAADELKVVLPNVKIHPVLKWQEMVRWQRYHANNHPRTIKVIEKETVAEESEGGPTKEEKIENNEA